jgi:hypothetical protein
MCFRCRMILAQIGATVLIINIRRQRIDGWANPSVRDERPTRLSALVGLCIALIGELQSVSDNGASSIWDNEHRP